MRAGVALLAAIAGLLGACSAAQAQSSSGESFLIIGGADLGHLSVTRIPVLVSGNVSVEYRGTPEAGCAAHGLCGLSGTLVWDPGRHASVQVERIRIHGKRRLLGGIEFSEASSVAHVRRPSPAGPTGLCGDTGGDSFDIGLLTPHVTSSLSVGLSDATSGLGATHCAAPLESDLVGLLPVRPFRHSQIRHGGGTLDLSTTRPFGTGGFSGVLRSTVVLHFGKPRRPQVLGFSAFRNERLRVATARYRVDRVSGGLTATFGGQSEPALCMPLDTCGLTGSISQSLPTASGRLELTTMARASRPKRDLFRALGVSAHGSARRLGASGAGVWTSHSAALRSVVDRPDGSGPCTDTLPMKAGLLFGDVSGGRLYLAYSSDAFHTRCPGPLMSDLSGFEGLAVGSVPVSALRHRRVTVHLSKGTKISGSGYSGTVRPSITVTLTRTSVSTRLISLPF